MNQHYKTNPTCYKQDLNYLNLRPSEIMYCRPVTLAMGHGEGWERAHLQACRPPLHPRRHTPDRPPRLRPCHCQYPLQILAAPTPPPPPRFYLYCTIVLLCYCTVTVVVLYAFGGSFILRVLSSVPKPPLLRPTSPESSAFIIFSLILSCASE